MQTGRFRTWFRAAAAALALTTTLMVFPMTGVAAGIQTVGDSTAVSADKAEQIGSMASASYAENGEAASRAGSTHGEHQGVPLRKRCDHGRDI